MKTFLYLLALHVSALGACAQSLTTTLIAPSEAIAPGATVSVELVTLNRGDQPAPVDLPAVLPATIRIGARSWMVELQGGAESRTQAAPGAFVSRNYRLQAPRDAAGPGVLEAGWRNQKGMTAVILFATDGEPPANGLRGPLIGPVAAASAAEAASPVLSNDAQNSALGRTFAGRMAAHEPVYIVYGNESRAAKFQFSFKYKLAAFGEATAESTPSTLQFGYTQRSLWDIDGDSSPFYDTSYMPELFWEWMKLPIGEEAGNFSWFGVQAGGKHESNGRDGLDSRSLNTAFVRTFFAFGPADGWRLVLMPEIFTYVGGMGENEDIDQYRGYGALRALIGKADGPALAFTGQAGEEFDHGSLQIDLTVPVHTRFLDMSVFFLVQYFSGYGESLRSYDQKSDSLRAGFSLIR